MAKSDSFFIRAFVDWNGTTYTQKSIDLGAYVDALGKSVLRIHNIAVQWDSALDVPAAGPGVNHTAAFQLTTQSQSNLVNADDKSVISTGTLIVSGGAAGETTQINDNLDIAPQMWKNGYLVGVEQIYLAVDQTLTLCSSSLSIVMECTVETLSQSAAMALALSQQ